MSAIKVPLNHPIFSSPNPHSENTVRTRVLPRPPIPQEPRVFLTPREKEILSLIVGEFTALDISKILGISLFTSETHWKNIRRKLGVRNTAGIVRVALVQGLVEWQEEWEDPVVEGRRLA